MEEIALKKIETLPLFKKPILERIYDDHSPLYPIYSKQIKLYAFKTPKSNKPPRLVPKPKEYETKYNADFFDTDKYKKIKHSISLDFSKVNNDEDDA